MKPHLIVSREGWLSARKALLIEEKKETRARDELARQRRELPWVRIEKSYVFVGPNGRETLGDLFAGRSQLIVQHFMFGPDWEEGCVGLAGYQMLLIHVFRSRSLRSTSRRSFSRFLRTDFGLVTVELASAGKSTEILLTHEELPSAPSRI
jgi:hypothetical protein